MFAPKTAGGNVAKTAAVLAAARPPYTAAPTLAPALPRAKASCFVLGVKNFLFPTP